MMKTVLAAALLASSITACNCIEGEGPVNSKTIELSGLKGIDVDGSLDVRLKQGSPQSVVLTAQQNLLDIIQFTVNDEVVYISSSKCYDSNKELFVEITLPRLESLSVDGSGHISGLGKFMVTELELELDGSGDINLDVDAAEIIADLNGSGNINLEGECKKFEADLNGSGDILSKKLKCEEAEATINGSGDIEVYVVDELEATVNGSGSISYKGKPDVDSNISGSGQVSPL